MSVQGKIKRRSVQSIIDQKKNGEKITSLTAYDFITAKLLDEADIDLILVGDSLNMVFAGEETTMSASLDQLIYHARIVRKAVQHSVVVCDMPFLSYQVSIEKAIENAGRIIKESSVHAVKIEGGERNIELVERLTEIGIPVMGHLGLTPQSIHQFGSYKTRAVEENEAKRLLEDAKLLEKAGCFSIVLEKIPQNLAKKVSQSLLIPSIGIGAGLDCDGQILVTEDMLGLFDEFKPKFVRRYNNLAEQIRDNIQSYIKSVQNRDFPSEKESY